MTLGQLLREARTKRRISLRRMARDLGVSASYLCDVEKDRRGIGWDAIGGFAAFYGLTGPQIIRASGMCRHCCGTGVVR